MEELEINGKKYPMNYITDLYVEDRKWFVLIYGEPAIETTDGKAIDKIIEFAPHLVDMEIRDTREGAAKLSRIFNDWMND